MGRSGTMTTWPSKLIICIFWPALRCSDSRICCGMTTWNFGDSMTVFISLLFWYDDKMFDGLCQPQGLVSFFIRSRHGQFIKDFLDDYFAGFFLGLGLVGDGHAVAQHVHADAFH